MNKWSLFRRHTLLPRPRWAASEGGGEWERKKNLHWPDRRKWGELGRAEPTLLQSREGPDSCKLCRLPKKASNSYFIYNSGQWDARLHKVLRRWLWREHIQRACTQQFSLRKPPFESSGKGRRFGFVFALRGGKVRWMTVFEGNWKLRCTWWPKMPRNIPAADCWWTRPRSSFVATSQRAQGPGQIQSLPRKNKKKIDYLKKAIRTEALFR